ncbi:hypothetical protein G6011_05635 [Alternaria panax]|uniref:Caspase domain-containing protein n=1 Tax=Alternaria panax TaxID=48097 RepID=A0AAD4FC69_9PLEO|nr:hypothetical protein G6011_05635 [Alternaria panax]
MHFDNSDIPGISTTENDLAKTFRDSYGIQTEQIALRSKNPRVQLTNELVDLANNGFADKDCLIVLVFSGHGMSEINPAYSISSHQAASNKLNVYGAINFDKKNKPTPLTDALDWVASTSYPDGLGCEILHILDCCYAVETTKAMAEVLAAGTKTVSANPEVCFTKALNEELKRLSSTSFTIPALYVDIRSHRVLHRLVYMPFFNKPKGSSNIVLKNQKLPTAKIRIPPKDGSRILLTAHLDKTVDQDAIRAIKDWLLKLVPSQVKDLEIKLEGAWDYVSSLLLFSLPTAIWVQLDPNNLAYSYVGEARSGNTLTAPSAQANVLAPPPAASSENKKPAGQFMG